MEGWSGKPHDASTPRPTRPLSVLYASSNDEYIFFRAHSSEIFRSLRPAVCAPPPPEAPAGVSWVLPHAWVPHLLLPRQWSPEREHTIAPPCELSCTTRNRTPILETLVSPVCSVLSCPVSCLL